MSAGTGVTHSEFNASNTKKAHFLQIWIIPNVQNTKPGYQQKTFATSEMENAFRLVVSPDGEDNSLVIKQDARMFTGKFDASAKIIFDANKHRKYWVQIAQGIAEVNAVPARADDGFAITNEDEIIIESQTETEILLFDLPQ